MVYIENIDLYTFMVNYIGCGKRRYNFTESHEITNAIDHDIDVIMGDEVEYHSCEGIVELVNDIHHGENMANLTLCTIITFNPNYDANVQNNLEILTSYLNRSFIENYTD